MISGSCAIRVEPSLRVYDTLTLAAWFLSEKDDEAARFLLDETKDIVHQALNAELIKKEVAQRITAGIDDTVAALEVKDYEKASARVLPPMSFSRDYALQQAVNCEFEKITEGLE